jgi:hypothetical protein
VWNSRITPDLRGLLFGEPAAFDQLIDLVNDGHELSDVFRGGD